jgi:hypothetical protein
MLMSAEERNVVVESVATAVRNSNLTVGIEAQELVEDGLQCTLHIEAALASTGPYIAAVKRDILPQLKQNVAQLDELFRALDNIERNILPQVDSSITSLEFKASELEKKREKPSSISKVLSLFGSQPEIKVNPSPVNVSFLNSV